MASPSEIGGRDGDVFTFGDRGRGVASPAPPRPVVIPTFVTQIAWGVILACGPRWARPVKARAQAQPVKARAQAQPVKARAQAQPEALSQGLGKEAVQQLFGTRVAALAGDFMFAQSSCNLANLENLEVIKLISQIVGADNPILMSAAEQIFSASGKRMRLALVFLVSTATAEIAGLMELTKEHRRLAEIIEMIHTANLIHDDVLDKSGMRSGKEAIHQLFGTRVAILVGDFMFNQSSWYLATLENLEVIKLISQPLIKSYYKIPSLITASTKGASIFSGVDSDINEQMYLYGKNLELSFQVVDDILDFTQSVEQLGKPAGSDLEKENLTAPVIFALEMKRGILETLAVFREAEQGKQRQTMHGRAFPSETRACAASGSPPEAPIQAAQPSVTEAQSSSPKPQPISQRPDPPGSPTPSALRPSALPDSHLSNPRVTPVRSQLAQTGLAQPLNRQQLGPNNF
ncbi:hypothetical protein HYC85_012989 [Camellia sinensis]|uniref:Uncharacterized protein n=1 Tax=Camellia sinensis TaxID=4442 RepID=A0A7J7HGL0_CAMSI|nr:hypothetical protein HYC85_012989 [Camellia sinensis]